MAGEGGCVTFCELQARLSFDMSLLGSTVPRKMGLNWFIPALAKRRVGSFNGTTLELGHLVCSFLLAKKLMNSSLTRDPGHSVILL